jgi:integrase/recombinase XerD
MTSPSIPALLAFPPDALPLPSTLDTLAAIPEEAVWLASRKSVETRRAYRHDVRHFLRTLGITSPDELRRVDHKAVVAWERYMREVEGVSPRTIRRRLAALSSLFQHLVRYRLVPTNPVREIARPAINRGEGMTPAFTPQQARALLDAPDATTVKGLRDRAILAVGLQVGFRRSEIVRLKVRDLHTTGGCDALRVTRKRGIRAIVAIHPETAQRLRAYLAAAGHADDREGPLFRPLHSGRFRQPLRRPLGPVRIDKIVQTYVRQLGLGPGYAAHSMRATFITTALANGAKLEDVQRTVGHADPATTQLYDRGRFTPQKSAALVVQYSDAEERRALRQ